MSEKKYPEYPVLLVDDETSFLSSAELALNTEGINNVVKCSDSQKVMGLLKGQSFTMVVLDLIMPGVHGLELLETLKNNFPEVPITMLTAINDVSVAVNCVKRGAENFLIKPLNENQFISEVKRVVKIRESKDFQFLLTEKFLSGKLSNPQLFQNIITQDLKMLAIFQYIEAIAPSQQTVLITGETGTGKELIAESIHTCSKNTGEFLKVNLAGLDDTLFSDTLFGHVPGAFTGASGSRMGMIKTAKNGTLFLDEIGDLNELSQIKLLRLLQENEYFTLGSDNTEKSATRIIAATNKDLPELVKQGKFRKDLYFRLNMHQVRIPPLRERKSDLEYLVNSFLEEAASLLGKKCPSYPHELIILLETYAFPGNIRELKSMVFEALSVHKSNMLSQKVFKELIGYELGPNDSGKKPENEIDFSTPENFPTLRSATLSLINAAMDKAKNNQSIAAKMLGISRQALNKRLNGSVMANEEK